MAFDLFLALGIVVSQHSRIVFEKHSGTEL